MIVGIVTIGTYFSPWFPYGLASFYFCDKIVVTNGGFNPKDPNIREFNIPLDEVTKTIEELDVHGKVIEWKNWTLKDLKHKLMLSTEKGHPKNVTWADMRGVGLTLAIEKATEIGADWILKFDSDQVGYEDCRAFKNNPQGATFYQYEFVGTKFRLADPPPDSPYNDSVYSFRAHQDHFFAGGGVPALSSVLNAPRPSTDQFHCAHLRYANPPELTREEQYQHFRDRIWFSAHTNDGLWGDALEKRAHNTALDILNKKGKDTVSPPKTCQLSRKQLLEYIEENYDG
jgi:hypothetical protein